MGKEIGIPAPINPSQNCVWDGVEEEIGMALVRVFMWDEKYGTEQSMTIGEKTYEFTAAKTVGGAQTNINNAAIILEEYGDKVQHKLVINNFISNLETNLETHGPDYELFTTMRREECIKHTKNREYIMSESRRLLGLIDSSRGKNKEAQRKYEIVKNRYDELCAA